MPIFISIEPVVLPDPDAENRRQWIVARRWDRFFGASGLAARFEELSDPLDEAWSIAVMVSGPDMRPRQVVQRFVESVKAGCFPIPGGFRYYGTISAGRRAVRDLINLYHFNLFPAGEYVLRPSTSTVEMAPEAMRARRSIWLRWILWQGWPPPRELQGAFQALYDARVTKDYAPTINDDRAFAKEPGVKREIIEGLRANNPDPRLHSQNRR